jgi:1-deoxy-D-xylulose-5-phosphate reductoisomerase
MKINHNQSIGPKRVTILGATGSVGQNTLDLIRRNKDQYKIVALTGNQNIEKLAEDAIEFQASYVATADDNNYSALKEALDGTDIECGAGERAVIEAADRNADICMASIVGVAGLKPTLKAIETTPVIGLANKECLVTAGKLFMSKARDFGAHIIPVDSEHSGAFQCLISESPENITAVTLTASGGPFRTHNIQELSAVTREQALKHPNWEMGSKITIDSATLMNKGLELIEASHLFQLEAEQVNMLIHPQSVVHCLVTLKDGSTLAQLSAPDMRVPISYSLAWPKRMETPIEQINLAEIGQLTFEPGDELRFPCLRLAREVLERQNIAGPVLNAANEVAVDAFLKDRCSFMAIPALIEAVLDKLEAAKSKYDPLDINSILHMDQQARYLAFDLLKLAV